MKFTLSWLKDHLDTDATLTEITDKLTAIGLELESVTDPARLYEPFFVAYVEKADKHPDADRLKVCLVDTGKEKIQVVCGAPNARTGMKGIFAPSGSYIPGTDITLKKGVIRGQESNGMLVSEREMGLSDNHEGIIEVSSDIALGTPFAALFGLDDPVIEIGLTPNRADCTGVRGIARDLAAAGLGTLKPLNDNPVTGTYESPIRVTLDLTDETRDACPLFIGRHIKNVKNGPSPDWMQARLKAIGLRPISALVDITNYMSFCLGRPLHVFDADKLKGDIQVRLAHQGETLAALNDKTYELDDTMTAICDDRGVVALGGVIGGADTGCTDSTTNVYLEVAYFDPMRTARTGRALQIISDARYRFERGVDPAFLPQAAEIATRLIIDLCGGTPSHHVVAGEAPAWERQIAFDPAIVKKLLGIVIPPEQQITILKSLGFDVAEETPSAWLVTPPSWRGDIEGRADLVEEIGRIYGYDKLEAVSVPKLTSVTQHAETNGMAHARKARTCLAQRGLNECVTWSFTNQERADDFGTLQKDDAARLQIVNPINAELTRMRPSILPNLIEAANRNHARGYPDNALFEVGPIFLNSKAVGGQRTVAAGIRSGHSGTKHWSGAHAARPVDIYDIKADALAALEACGAPAQNMQITRDAPAWYHPGRSGVLRLGAKIYACFGEIHPALLEKMDSREHICAFEVFIDDLPQPRKKGTGKALLTLSPFQPLHRDFAFLVDEDVAAETMIRAAIAADKTMIVAADIFDVYQGKGVETGKKSVALHITIQPREQTLTDKDLEDLSQKVIAQILEKTGGSLRQ